MYLMLFNQLDAHNSDGINHPVLMPVSDKIIKYNSELWHSWEIYDHHKTAENQRQSKMTVLLRLWSINKFLDAVDLLITNNSS